MAHCSVFLATGPSCKFHIILEAIKPGAIWKQTQINGLEGRRVYVFILEGFYSLQIILNSGLRLEKEGYLTKASHLSRPVKWRRLPFQTPESLALYCPLTVAFKIRHSRVDIIVFSRIDQALSRDVNFDARPHAPKLCKILIETVHVYSMKGIDM